MRTDDQWTHTEDGEETAEDPSMRLKQDNAIKQLSDCSGDTLYPTVYQ
jgi:hypothetical protein